MEKSEIGIPNSCHETPLFSFPSHCRSHLKSETYHMLVHIFSHCYDHSQVSLTTPITLEKPGNKDNGLEQGAEKKADEPDEFISPVSTKHESSLHQPAVVGKDSEATSFEDRGFCETQMVVIDHVMQREEIEDILKQNDIMTDDDFDGTHSQDGGLSQQQIIMNELELLIKGNENLVPNDHINLSVTSWDENQNGNVVPTSVNNQEQQHDLQPIVTEELESAAKLQGDEEECTQKMSGASDISLDKTLFSEVSKLSMNADGTNSFLKTTSLEGMQEIKKNEMEWDKQASYSCISPSIPNCIIKDLDIEEGEISGDFRNDDESFDMFLGDDLRPEGKLEGKRDRDVQLKEHVTNRMLSNIELVVHGISTAAIGVDTDKFMRSAGENKQKDIGTEGVGCKVACTDNLVSCGEMVEKYADEYQGISFGKKLDAAVCCKKKRAPPSEERKEKKKERKRKQRAKKNRQLGVKRLKLRPVVKPKTVAYCQHYLKGRCYEGEKCKFSHDTIPLTKSKPCCHFARHSCMKGNDCPFDHQLSKYPCANFFAKGFCNRGGDCMFSHEIPPKEAIPSASASDTLKPEANPPSFIGASHSKKQLTNETSHQNANGSCYSMGVLSSDHSKENIIDNVLQTKGFSSPPAGKLSVQFCKSHQSDSSLKTNESTEDWKLNSQHTSDKVGSMNGIQMKVPAAAPKGLNFLSFGKESPEDSSDGKLTSLTLNGENGFKATPLKMSSLQDQLISSSSREKIIKLGNQTLPGMSSTNEMLKKAQPVAAPRGMGFFSSGRDLIDESGDFGSPFSFGFVRSKLVQRNENASEKHQNHIEKLQKLPALPAAQGQALDQLPYGLCKNTSNASQKSLLSALTFAAKFESEMKINKSNSCTVAVNRKETTDGSVCGGSRNDSSRLLEFLSSLNSKRKQ